MSRSHQYLAASLQHRSSGYLNTLQRVAGVAFYKHHCHIIQMIIGGHVTLCLRLCLTPGLYLCAATECRHLHFNQLAGALPVTWSALAGLNIMWVPCALLMRWCNLAASAACLDCAAGFWCTYSDNFRSDMGTQRRPGTHAACFCRRI
jgi:hypothetical protein